MVGYPKCVKAKKGACGDRRQFSGVASVGNDAVCVQTHDPLRQLY
jgi:hypothetical protein